MYSQSKLKLQLEGNFYLKDTSESVKITISQ
jgi:hypothetical protein